MSMSRQSCINVNLKNVQNVYVFTSLKKNNNFTCIFFIKMFNFFRAKLDNFLTKNPCFRHVKLSKTKSKTCMRVNKKILP